MQHCTAPNCDAPLYIKKHGVCRAHYVRLLEAIHADRPKIITMGMIERFRSRVRKADNGCWEWQGKLGPAGYGTFYLKYQTMGAHRASYMIYKGDIPAGYDIDHLCRVRHCVNPAHLEAVTPTENKRRGVGWAGTNARKTHCAQGHELTPENVDLERRGFRDCRICRKEHAHSGRKKKMSNA